MRSINSINELNLPAKHKKFILDYLGNIADIDCIDKIILFGSCATGNANENSDVDIYITTKYEVTKDIEYKIIFDLVPIHDYKENYVENDILLTSREHYEKYKLSIGMVQKQIEKEGVILNGLLQYSKA